ncbi:hypothetical protein BU24DRAFT_412327 [Aaosphaeria arxii CBS 175.79]|uniref:Uncharacterized protein n=1 Tax=Aaosphaeria arxii CBS 175.79 TaxID=1450172 RepID=A0A6A5XJ92_9PLEO|nr:uncharacterized protein BU24DRAFT_412327 [Aaosphaeria arxii CBS 175.79]KAF2013023.1 hypothetical protein BU24DRAFT_412327 [Aaosphaeria arxii CBS 175.79]
MSFAFNTAPILPEVPFEVAAGSQKIVGKVKNAWAPTKAVTGNEAGGCRSVPKEIWWAGRGGGLGRLWEGDLKRRLDVVHREALGSRDSSPGPPISMGAALDEVDTTLMDWRVMEKRFTQDDGPDVRRMCSQASTEPAMPSDIGRLRSLAIMDEKDAYVYCASVGG